LRKFKSATAFELGRRNSRSRSLECLASSLGYARSDWISVDDQGSNRADDWSFISEQWWPLVALPRFFRHPRNALLLLLEHIPLSSTSQDQSLEKAIAFHSGAPVSKQ
jgi:hypothetical protein